MADEQPVTYTPLITIKMVYSSPFNTYTDRCTFNIPPVSGSHFVSYATA